MKIYIYKDEKKFKVSQFQFPDLKCILIAEAETLIENILNSKNEGYFLSLLKKGKNIN
jgi:hypothetical protein